MCWNSSPSYIPPCSSSTIGEVTFEGAAYVARYVLKKWSKEDLKEEDLYEAMRAYDEAKKGINLPAYPPGSTEALRASYYQGRHPEYITMSRNPGIGEAWYRQYSSDLYPSGFALTPSGVKVKPAKYYDSRFEIDNPLASAMLKVSRLKASQGKASNSRGRLAIREEVKKLTIKTLTRRLEDES